MSSSGSSAPRDSNAEQLSLFEALPTPSEPHRGVDDDDDAESRPLRPDRREVVGGPRLHLKHDAVLPVGGKRGRLVPGARDPEATDPFARPAVAPRRGLVRHPADARRAPAAARDEIRRIFAGIGLEGPFWDPESDEFG